MDVTMASPLPLRAMRKGFDDLEAVLKKDRETRV